MEKKERQWINEKKKIIKQTCGRSFPANHGRRCIVIVIGIATHVHPTISRFRYRKGERRGQTRDKASSLRRVNLSITGGESTTMDKVVVGPVQGAFTDVDKWSDWS